MRVELCEICELLYFGAIKAIIFLAQVLKMKLVICSLAKLLVDLIIFMLSVAIEKLLFWRMQLTH